MLNKVPRYSLSSEKLVDIKLTKFYVEKVVQGHNK
jgi:hypothetical protein